MENVPSLEFHPIISLNYNHKELPKHVSFSKGFMRSMFFTTFEKGKVSQFTVTVFLINLKAVKVTRLFKRCVNLTPNCNSRNEIFMLNDDLIMM